MTEAEILRRFFKEATAEEMAALLIEATQAKPAFTAEIICLFTPTPLRT